MTAITTNTPPSTQASLATSISEVMSIQDIQAMEAFVEVTHIQSHTRGNGPHTLFVNGGPYMDIYGWQTLTEFPIAGTLSAYAQLDTGLSKLPSGHEVNLDNLVLQYTGVFLKTLEPGIPFRIMAHSFGGVLARLAHERYLSKLPIDYTLILVDPLPFTLAGWVAYRGNVKKDIEERGVQRSINVLKNTYSRADTQNAKDILATGILKMTLPSLTVQTPKANLVVPEGLKNWNPLAADRLTDAFALENGGYNWTEGPWPKELYLVHGEQDPAKLGPIPCLSAPEIEIPNAGHYSPWEQPAAFWQAMQGILLAEEKPPSRCAIQ